ncbi:hypothetical protein DFQ27_005147 [Actinomortierella ambigua]|uniref:Uncharacterized protein n=1 Tax=Actinomortierella ambigua TaxID=1343610 RepID=A0A9P6U3C8_9FUNG|nr:hypothetical protein DFQ27_005147 [Actinomortierella ambigua]
MVANLERAIKTLQGDTEDQIRYLRAHYVVWRNIDEGIEGAYRRPSKRRLGSSSSSSDGGSVGSGEGCGEGARGSQERKQAHEVLKMALERAAKAEERANKCSKTLGTTLTRSVQAEQGATIEMHMFQEAQASFVHARKVALQAQAHYEALVTAMTTTTTTTAAAAADPTTATARLPSDPSQPPSEQQKQKQRSSPRSQKVGVKRNRREDDEDEDVEAIYDDDYDEDDGGDDRRRRDSRGRDGDENDDDADDTYDRIESSQDYDAPLVISGPSLTQSSTFPRRVSSFAHQDSRSSLDSISPPQKDSAMESELDRT